MSDQDDAYHEWIHSIHTMQLRAKAQSLLSQRRQMLITLCAMSTDLKVAQSYGEYAKALAINELLEKGDL